MESVSEFPEDVWMFGLKFIKVEKNKHYDLLPSVTWAAKQELITKFFDYHFGCHLTLRFINNLIALWKHTWS